jgi:hypothetical protein
MRVHLWICRRLHCGRWLLGSARSLEWSVQVHVIRLGCGPPFDARSGRDQALRFDRRWVS